jgi:hypothetical protein
MQILQQLTIIHPELLSTIEATVRIENDPYMPLTIEYIGLGPRGLPALSIAHYGEQNGDLMRDPEMCFEVEIENGYAKRFHPFYYRNDYVGVEQFSVIHDGTDPDNKPVCRICARILRHQIKFAQIWDANLAAQGFVKAHTATLNL